MIPDKAVEAALAVGNFQHSDVLEGMIIRYDREWCGYVGNMGTILEDFIKAAAPFIAAATLHAHADYLEHHEDGVQTGDPWDDGYARAVKHTRDRADELEAGQ